ncbi:phospho-N-acetylmuramoyl-pentapeptide-transferase [Campylobacter sp. LR291e]|nr:MULTISPECIES: phospho-N-acetylmuramoyl-pentapeptide-transferase [unclassified Campylobacter]KAA6225504.1 phospho-N-acetylmuramoyl-pentapeptide-transferase [Campylobacter sp. LR196d]KAA6226941.1 phospho-N-acetylmuramoyl-pentapeptide-transferase [Campylobacter sp. LR185c]KAA6229775.1 phospho-N-acetylmuramoyl-pentapeptide-transferase [Campylobacter sp. LR286c]KAA6234300.1 phospho-N-acetylmuramoyl-pentapeptide-transferase [Campylobacter sp. LR291e]KAA6234519.1 phospho-N-acetylmuramoyl-pentapept
MFYISYFSDYAFFTYISVRAGFAFFIALCLSLFIMPKFINWARSKNAKQPIYELAPDNHKTKSNTPTMGGLIFVGCAVFSSLLCIKFNVLTLISLLCLILFCLIGLIDDLNKILKKDNHLGLSPKTKLFLQCLASLCCGLLLYFFTDLNGDFYIPFYKHALFNMHIFTIVFWILVLIASSNAVNLTDGLDGLATVPSIISIVTLGIFLYLSGNLIYSEYLLLPKIQGLGEVVIICASLVGSLMGFLWYNCYPAQVFMGDSGSLALGAFIGFLGIISKNEFLLLLIGFVFVLETISVILQVGSFKIFNKRVFKMAPIHHHFEKVGWVENKIIVRFWMIALLSNLLALASIKLR